MAEDIPPVEVTVRSMPLPGVSAGTVGVGQPGPNVTFKPPSVLEYLFLDVLAFSYVTGWITASAFWGAGQFAEHGLTPSSSPIAVLLYISRQALIPAGILAMKDVSVWLLKRRQAHGL